MLRFWVFQVSGFSWKAQAYIYRNQAIKLTHFPAFGVSHTPPHSAAYPATRVSVPSDQHLYRILRPHAIVTPRRVAAHIPVESNLFEVKSTLIVAERDAGLSRSTIPVIQVSSRRSQPKPFYQNAPPRRSVSESGSTWFLRRKRKSIILARPPNHTTALNLSRWECLEGLARRKTTAILMLILMLMLMLALALVSAQLDRTETGRTTGKTTTRAASTA